MVDLGNQPGQFVRPRWPLLLILEELRMGVEERGVEIAAFEVGIIDQIQIKGNGGLGTDDHVVAADSGATGPRSRSR